MCYVYESCGDHFQLILPKYIRVCVALTLYVAIYGVYIKRINMGCGSK